jgi:uroporphyrinogen decarboxylase
MTGLERFLAASRCQPVDRPPVWMMRQAGRYLPEYQCLKQKYTFHEMVRTPDLATEVTMQPIHRYGFDAAIIFSDILVVPGALGQPFAFREGRGVRMEFPVRNADDFARLSSEGAAQRLDYVYQALRQTREALGSARALLGFGGSPWTLAAYMIEGGSSEDGAIVRAMAARRDPVLVRLLEMLTEVLADYFRGQIEAGADAIQIFDSWATWCQDYEEWSLRWVREVVKRLRPKVPVIFFARGRNRDAASLVSTGATVLSLDWETKLGEVRRALGREIALQGNLDPAVLEGAPEKAAAAAREVLADMAPYPGHIFNLGHGIRPSARLESVGAVVEAVQSFTKDNDAVAAR